MIKAILMDFNGVIINDEPLQMKAYADCLKREGIELTEEDYYSCTGMDDRAFVKEQFRRAGKKISDEKLEEIIKEKTGKWREGLRDEIPLFEGVENFIKKCSHRFSLGLVSMANREEINYVLDETGLAKYFDVVISAEDVKNHKPNPECFLKAFRQIDKIRSSRNHLPLERYECLVIEDVPQGIEAAKSIGMKTLAVKNTFDEHTLRSCGADAVTANLNGWFPDSIIRVFPRF
ncbi:MAG: HAD family phosphatase [Pyrinomonadaceae bacterium]|nr:HAD family phosphatase [Pyrinomonadaceae bacterium]MCX7638901.1 HAD family phosphatase [Pyrinomonadaceae bacterium]MDW8304962.1 HAD family phosphatase [Acidobacteriota bacterium]